MQKKKWDRTHMLKIKQRIKKKQTKARRKAYKNRGEEGAPLRQNEG